MSPGVRCPSPSPLRLRLASREGPDPQRGLPCDRLPSQGSHPPAPPASEALGAPEAQTRATGPVWPPRWLRPCSVFGRQAIISAPSAWRRFSLSCSASWIAKASCACLLASGLPSARSARPTMDRPPALSPPPAVTLRPAALGPLLPSPDPGPHLRRVARCAPRCAAGGPRPSLWGDAHGLSFSVAAHDRRRHRLDRLPGSLGRRSGPRRRSDSPCCCASALPAPGPPHRQRQ